MASGQRTTFRQPSFNSSMIPSPSDLLLALPRLFSFTFNYLPEQLDDLFSMAKSPGRVVPDATSKAVVSNSSLMPSGTPFTRSPGSASLKSSQPIPSGGFFSFIRSFSVSESISNLDGIFSYIASRWAISTFLIAVVLNRAHVYASSRRRLRLNWESRLIMRVIPILLFLYQVETILQTLRCQTGPMLAETQLADTDTLLNGSFTNEGGPLHTISSTLLFWQTEADSCRSAGMFQPDNPASAVGSSALLWPLFLSLCISHFVETVSCALQGRQPMAETGMTIFEHSLAFAEAEAVVRSSIGLGLFGLPKGGQVSDENMSKLANLTRSVVMQKLNVPPEVLLIALISSMSHLTSHILAVFRLQSRCRLVNTFIWGSCFMGAFLWSFIRFSYSNPNLAVIRYPTVCIIGFIPHFLVIVGTTICGTIYVLSLMLTLLSPPTSQYSQGTFRERLRMARNNLQASAALSNIHISWRDEFYTTLMKVGFSILTAASEAVYFNEGTRVTVANQTWLESQRHAEIVDRANLTSARRKNAAFVPPEIQGNVVAEGLSMVDDPPDQQTTKTASGFATERKAGKSGLKIGTAATREEGVGRSQYHGRAHLSATFVFETLKLIVRCQAKFVIIVLRFAGVGRVPSWLQALARTHVQIAKEQPSAASAPSTLDFWMRSDDGTLHLPSGTSVDVEMETRKSLGTRHGQQEDEDRIDQNLYRWWQNGGFWGELDASGDYAPSELDDEDATSVISTNATSEADSDERDWSDEEENGRRTPTQRNYRDMTNHSAAIGDETLQDLSRLLAPKTLEDRHEARILARHLNCAGPITRARYNRLEHSERLAILRQTPHAAHDDPPPPMSPEEEEELLEQLVRSRRSKGAATSTTSAGASSGNVTSWTQGAEGMGAEGPQCVVCRSAPRTILVWPCRCLSLCEECRVSLAMNNFANCVCCRREVVAFSRLYVP